MSRDPIIESHIAQSRAKIEKAAPDTVEAERRIDRTKQALARSRGLLERIRDPLHLARRLGGIVSGAIAEGSGAVMATRAWRKAKPKPNRRG